MIYSIARYLLWDHNVSYILTGMAVSYVISWLIGQHYNDTRVYCNITSSVYLPQVTNNVARDLMLFQPVMGSQDFTVISNWWPFINNNYFGMMSTLFALSVLSRQGGLCVSDKKWFYRESPNMQISNWYQVSTKWYIENIVCLIFCIWILPCCVEWIPSLIFSLNHSSMS